MKANIRTRTDPFFCDFYVKSEDLFIECNFHWTHGDHPFDANSTEDCMLRDEWLRKAQDFYTHAVYVWTDLDVRKRQCAINNQLNYQSVYMAKGGKYVIF